MNRQTLREILAARLDGVIEFGRACTGFEQRPGGVTVQFGDGSSADADVLVGADGIGSPVRRRYLPHALVEDTGIVCVYGRTPLTAQTRPLLPAPVRDGFTAVLGSGVGMAAGLLDFREPPPQAARRIAPDVRLSPAQSYLMWAVTGAAGQFAGPATWPAAWASYPRRACTRRPRTRSAAGIRTSSGSSRWPPCRRPP